MRVAFWGNPLLGSLEMNNPIHVAITRHVKSGSEAAFESAILNFIAESAITNDSLGAQLIKPLPGAQKSIYGILRSFASEQDRDTFYQSESIPRVGANHSSACGSGVYPTGPSRPGSLFCGPQYYQASPTLENGHRHLDGSLAHRFADFTTGIPSSDRITHLDRHRNRHHTGRIGTNMGGDASAD